MGAMNTIYMSKLNLDTNIIKECIKQQAEKGHDVDCSVYRNDSFTAGQWETGLKIEFFNIEPSVMWELYLNWRREAGINCIVIDMPDFFGCIVKSPLNKCNEFTCSND